MYDKIKEQIIDIDWVKSLKNKILNLDAISHKTEKNLVDLYEVQEKLSKHLMHLMAKYDIKEDKQFKKLQSLITSKLEKIKQLNDEQKYYVEVSKKDIEKSMSFIRSFYDKTTKDALTKLWNEEFINNLMEVLWEENKKFFLIYFDLNNLKMTNDTYGHDVGDMLIKKFAEILKLIFGEEKNYIARLHGDEFCIVSLDTEQDIKHKLDKLSQWLENTKLEVINEKTNKKERINVNTAYGCASSTEATSIQDMVRKADKNMYKHKLETKTK